MKIQYKIIDTTSQFINLRRDWEILLQKSKIASPFLTWEWMYCWWISYAEKEHANSLCIIIAKEDDSLVGILPGYIKKQRLFGRNILTFMFLGSEFESSDYLDVIQKDTFDEELVFGLFQSLVKEKKIDKISLFNIIETSQILRAAKIFARKIDANFVVKPHRICPYLPIEGSWDNFVSGLSSNLRYNLRRRTRKLFNEFRAELKTVQDLSELNGAIDELFILHEERFKYKQEKSIFRADKRKNFHKKVSEYLLEKNILKIFRLSISNKTIAILYCFEFANMLFYYQFGMDPEWAKYSPGVVIMGQGIKYAFDNKLNFFDFMRGGENYKFMWTEKFRNMFILEFAISQKGKQILALREFGLGMKNSIKTIMPTRIWNSLKGLKQ